MSYAWFFHIPFIVCSSKEFSTGTKYILRFYPEGLEKKEVENVFSFNRESKIGESENAGFFYYIAFPAEDLFREIFLGEKEIELKGNMALVLITEAGEEVIFPFDLSKIR